MTVSTLELLPWEKPLTKPLAEPMRCIGCNRHGRELLEAGTSWRTGSEFHGLAICWQCAEDEDLRAEYVAAREAVSNVKGEPEASAALSGTALAAGENDLTVATHSPGASALPRREGTNA